MTAATSTATATSPAATALLGRVLVATDRSETADRAVRWAAALAAAHQAELLLFQALPPLPDADSSSQEDRSDQATADLQRFASELAGPRGRALAITHADPARAIVDVAAAERVDTIVVGNLGMSGRKQFLLGNIPNRVSHTARCTVVIVNTALPDGSGGRRSPWGAWPEVRGGSPRPLDGQLSRRAWRIGRVMVAAGLRDVLVRSRGMADTDTTRAAASRFRTALDELGPTFAKLGQILSTRPDLLPPAFVEELATLRERVTPLTEAEVVAAMERELGVPWEDVFASIDPTPLAAGTIAQVHRATLESGERVVVKVQRPTAERDISQDLGLLELFATRAAQRPALKRVFDIPAMIGHLSASLRRELDFREEARNMLHMREVLANFSRLEVPHVYQEYSTGRLLVMQEVQGTGVLESPPGRAREEAARQLLEGFYQQVMVDGFFHADPHPGNLKWWNDAIYFLDLGMVGELKPGVREAILMLLLAFSQKDAAFLAEVVLALAGTAEGVQIDSAAFQDDLAGLIARYRDLSLREIQLGPILQEVTEIAVRHEVRVPADLMLAGKAFAQMQLVAAELDPTLDPFAVAEAFVMRNTLRQFTRHLNPETMFYESQKMRVRLTRVLSGVESILSGDGGSNLQVRFKGTENLERSLQQASRRVALSLGASGAFVGAAVTAASGRSPRWTPGVLGAAGSLLAAALAADSVRGRRP